jgi:ABC-2 type transport system permease protein
VIGLLCLAGGMILTRTQGLSLPDMVFQPPSLMMSTVILLSGFLLFTALLVALGAAVPTEKDAQSLFSAVLMILMLPLIAMVILLTSSPQSPVIDVLTYFPLTAAPTALLRNAVGTLTWWQGTIVVVVTLACAAVILKIAAKLFRQGSIEYNRKVSLRSVLA